MPPSQSNDGTPQFSQLWPTQFMSLRLPGNDTANPVLTDFVLAQNILDILCQYKIGQYRICRIIAGQS